MITSPLPIISNLMTIPTKRNNCDCQCVLTVKKSPLFTLPLQEMRQETCYVRSGNDEFSISLFHSVFYIIKPVLNLSFCKIS